MALLPGRLLLFEPNPGKRYYFQKYVLGGLWRGLTEAEKEKRIIEALKRRRDQSNDPDGG